LGKVDDTQRKRCDSNPTHATDNLACTLTTTRGVCVCVPRLCVRVWACVWACFARSPRPESNTKQRCNARHTHAQRRFRSVRSPTQRKGEKKISQNPASWQRATWPFRAVTNARGNMTLSCENARGIKPHTQAGKQARRHVSGRRRPRKAFLDGLIERKETEQLMGRKGGCGRV